MADQRERLTERGTLSERVDFFRLDACGRLDDARRAEMGQFLTPPRIAQFMASMCQVTGPSLSFLDAGAGVGSLAAAWVEELCARPERPRKLSVVAYEIEPLLLEYLKETFELCTDYCGERGVKFTSDIRPVDFIREGVESVTSDLFGKGVAFDCSILNPPYRKINVDSETRRLLKRLGVQTNNLYTSFLAVVVHMLRKGGELVAITPRSFCNGPYFRPFRQLLLSEMNLQRLHVFDSRVRAFSDDDVLQENVIFRAIKGEPKTTGMHVMVSSSEGPEDEALTAREVPYASVVQTSKTDSFIHIVPDEGGEHVAERMSGFEATLPDLGLRVSTGRVVDFRAREYLRPQAETGTVPLIYPAHFESGFVAWPNPRTKKPNAIIASEGSRDLLVPSGVYVLVKRFSTKEERRRLVAVVYDPRRLPPAEFVGFENHLNYYHHDGHGLPLDVAKGLAAFLNSTLADTYFRQFNGHTQVNATDLRSLRYPALADLKRVGARIREDFPTQDELDSWIEQEFIRMGGDTAFENGGTGID